MKTLKELLLETSSFILILSCLSLNKKKSTSESKSPNKYFKQKSVFLIILSGLITAFNENRRSKKRISYKYFI